MLVCYYSSFASQDAILTFRKPNKIETMIKDVLIWTFANLSEILLFYIKN